MAKKVTTLQRPLRSPYGKLNADYTDENDNAWPSVQAYLDSVAARHGTVPKRMAILVDIDGVETEMTNFGQESTSAFVVAIDAMPAQDSARAVQSKGVYSAIAQIEQKIGDVNSVLEQL